MTALALALSFLGCLAFAAFWRWLEVTHRPAPPSSAVTDRLALVEEMTKGCRQWIDAQELAGGMRGAKR